MDRIHILGMVEAYSKVSPSDDTKAIWAKLVSSYGEDKAAAMLISMVADFGPGYFDQISKVSHLEAEAAKVTNLEMQVSHLTAKVKALDYKSKVKSGQIKPAQKCSTSQVEDLYYSGLGVNERASKLGISRTTVWRKLKDVKKLKEQANDIFCEEDEPKEVENNKGKKIMTTEEIFGD